MLFTTTSDAFVVSNGDRSTVGDSITDAANIQHYTACTNDTVKQPAILFQM